MTLLNTLPSSNPATGCADAVLHFAGAHGYHLDRDHVTLWAEIQGDLRDDLAVGAYRDVLLALWAEPVDAVDASASILVAQLHAKIPVADGGPNVVVEGVLPAAVPSGSAAWRMVLTLSVVGADGLATLQDRSVFAQTQSFLQPRIVTAAPLRASRVDVGLQIDSVAMYNPRPVDNLSGSLCLELWALAQPYTGGAFAGQCLGTVGVGQLGGQTGHDCLGETWAAPADAAAVLVLMLREWTQDGLLTRDHGAVTLVAPAPAPTPVPAVKPRARPAHLLNVNVATEEQLVAIDGLNRALAKAVIAARPFASIDDLLDIRGVGDKRLARMRRHLCV